MVNKPSMTPAQAEYQAQKNENDFKRETNQTLASLQLAIDQLNKNLSQAIAKQGSDKVSFEVMISNLFEVTNNLVQKIDQRVDEFEKRSKANQELAVYRIDKFEANAAFKEDVAEQLILVNARLFSLEKGWECLKNEFRDSLQHLNNQFESKIAQLEKKALAKPDCVLETKKELEEKIDVFRLDLDTANLRSANNQRQLDFVEKKFENVYQLIKKLNLQ